MSNQSDAQAEGGAPPVKKLPIGKLILLILLPILLIVGAVAGLFLTGMLGGKKASAPAAVEDSAPPQASGGHYSALSDFILTIRTETGEARVVMVTISLQLTSQEENAIVKSGDARLRDAINILLSEQPLRTYSDPVALNDLRAKLSDEIRRILPDLDLLGVYLTRVRVQ